MCVYKCVCLLMHVYVSHGSQTTLFVPLDGGESGTELQQRDSTHLGAAGQQSSLVLKL